jgi:G3E family GTPase
VTASEQAGYVMIGGFLGAGKTTAVAALAKALTDSGRRVGLITNDQSSGLVDTALLRAKGFAVEEIAGGCFCCRFDSLSEAADRLCAQTRPHLFLAEPVGSCTDLVATVSYPLRRIYGDRYRIAPLSVLVDPQRAARIFGIAEGRPFSTKVVYVYKKQLEEADFIVINKCDSIADELQLQLVAALERDYPRAEIFCISAKLGTGLDTWLERILASEAEDRPAMELDYDLYAEGEAELGWLNATWQVSSSQDFDGNALLVRLSEDLRQRIVLEEREIAHLKMTLISAAAGGQLSAVSIASNSAEPDLREALLDQIRGGTLVLNLRAEMSPDRMSALVNSVRESENRGADTITLRNDHEESFRPARPEPTHRIRVPGND